MSIDTAYTFFLWLSTITSTKSTTLPIILFSRCLVWRFLGGFKKLNIIGIKKMESINTKNISMAATIPNSTNIALLVEINVAKPNAVVVLVRKIAFPVFSITLLRALIWLLCFLYSLWYLFNKKIQLGMPITIISGGIKPVKSVISKSNNDKTPSDQTTPILTTSMEYIITLNERKNKYKISEVTKIESNKNNSTSSATLVVEFALI